VSIALPNLDPVVSAEVAELRYVNDARLPGIRRIRRGRGSCYRDPHGRPITTRDLQRIRSLAIPPAWTDVWICPDERGHLQATGVDAAGRKQYLYHALWRARRDQAKFDAMLDFAEALPRLRRRVRRDLRGDEITRTRVLACAVRLPDLGFFRIGSESYAEDNGSYGLATMLKLHVRIKSEEIVFDYEAKGGARRVQAIVDPPARDVLAALKRRRAGPKLLAGGSTCAQTTSTSTSSRSPAATSPPRTSAPGTRPCSPQSRWPRTPMRTPRPPANER
jgi:DNA topoisomerase IB